MKHSFSAHLGQNPLQHCCISHAHTDTLLVPKVIGMFPPFTSTVNVSTQTVKPKSKSGHVYNVGQIESSWALPLAKWLPKFIFKSNLKASLT